MEVTCAFGQIVECPWWYAADSSDSKDFRAKHGRDLYLTDIDEYDRICKVGVSEMPSAPSLSAPSSAFIIAIDFDSEVSSDCCMVCLFRSCHVTHAALLTKSNVSMHYSSQKGTVSDGPCHLVVLVIVLTRHALVDAIVDS